MTANQSPPQPGEYTGDVTGGTGDYSVMASYARELPPEPGEISDCLARVYGMPLPDALIAFDRDLMIGDGWPCAAAERMALQHARDRALGDTKQQQLEAGQ